MSGGAPVQTIALATVLAAERVAWLVWTARRGPARSVEGHLTTALWGVCVFGSLATALAALDFFGQGVSPARFAAGILLVAGGAGLRIAALRRLGRFFSELIVIREDHALVTDGPYRVLRHPLHVGLIVLTSGLAVLSVSAWAWGFPALAIAVAVPRERREERLLEERFGDAYRKWAARSLGWTDLLAHRSEG